MTHARPYLIVVVLAHSIIFGSILCMMMGEEKDIGIHALYVRILLDEFMVLEFRVERGSTKCSASHGVHM